MPVINFDYQDLLGLLRLDLTMDELIHIIPMMGADLHDVDERTGEISMEFFPDRPDLFSVEGISRALRSFIGVESGIRFYQVEDSGMTITNEPSTGSVRPFVVAGVMRDVVMTDELIRSLMETQEKLHLTIGRKRAKVSIGVHDLDRVKPPFFYRAVEPESVSFVPLAKTEEMSLREILGKHEKGIDYAFILEGKKKYPIIVDRNGEVLSFPPIINGRLTTVTEETTSLFIDVTGTDLKAISGALNIVATSIAERGARIESVTVLGKEKMITPDLDPREWQLEGDFCRSFLGVDIGDEAICQCLAKMGFDARPDGKSIRVLAPAVRMDLLHPVDLAEDVAIGYGYQNFGHSLPGTQTFGRVRPIEHLSDLIRQLMVGYGYTEVSTLMLSSPREQFDLLCLPPQETVEIQNPITEDHTCIRVSLLPNMMAVLRRNKHRDLPQRIFEVGDVMVNLRRHRFLAGISVHSRASFTEMKSLIQSLLRDCSVQYSLEPCGTRMYIDGRAASVLLDDQEVGHFGEVSPEVIANLDLDHPIGVFEMDIETMLLDRLGKVF
jgi:phenylalanyl-tRNA synthetase beta chain